MKKHSSAHWLHVHTGVWSYFPSGQLSCIKICRFGSFFWFSWILRPAVTICFYSFVVIYTIKWLLGWSYAFLQCLLQYAWLCWQKWSVFCILNTWCFLKKNYFTLFSPYNCLKRSRLHLAVTQLPTSLSPSSSTR